MLLGVVDWHPQYGFVAWGGLHGYIVLSEDCHESVGLWKVYLTEDVAET